MIFEIFRVLFLHFKHLLMNSNLFYIIFMIFTRFQGRAIGFKFLYSRLSKRSMKLKRCNLYHFKQKYKINDRGKKDYAVSILRALVYHKHSHTWQSSRRGCDKARCQRYRRRQGWIPRQLRLWNHIIHWLIFCFYFQNETKNRPCVHISQRPFSWQCNNRLAAKIDISNVPYVVTHVVNVVFLMVRIQMLREWLVLCTYFEKKTKTLT